MFVREQAIKNIFKTLEKVEPDLPLRFKQITFDEFKTLMNKKEDKKEDVPVINKFLSLFQKGLEEFPSKSIMKESVKLTKDERRRSSAMQNVKIVSSIPLDSQTPKENTRFGLTRGSLAVSKLLTKREKKEANFIPLKFGVPFQIKFRFFESKGIVIGNGYATNNLKVSFDPASQLFQFRNSLFVLERKVEENKGSEFFDEGYEEDDSEAFIYYEQEFMIKHVESGKTLVLLEDDIADEIGCLKVELTSEICQSFFAKGIGQTKGKIIMFGERLHICSSKTPTHFLHIQIPNEKNPEIELELNGKEEPTFFSLKQIENYQKFNTENSDYSESLKAHDYIRISRPEEEIMLSSTKSRVSIIKVVKEESEDSLLIMESAKLPEEVTMEYEKLSMDSDPWSSWQIIPLQKYKDSFLPDKALVAFLNMSSSRILASSENKLIEVEEFDLDLCKFTVKAKKSYNPNLLNNSYVMIQDAMENSLTFKDGKFSFISEFGDSDYFHLMRIKDEDIPICLYAPNFYSELTKIILKFQTQASNKISINDKFDSLIKEWDSFAFRFPFEKEIRQKVFDSYDIPMMIPLLLQFVPKPKDLIPYILELIEENEEIANKLYSNYMEIMIKVIDQDTDCLISFIRSIGEVGDSLGIKKWAPVLEDYQEMSLNSLGSCTKHLKILGELLISNRGEAIHKYQVALAQYLEQARVGKLIMGLLDGRVWVSFWRGGLAQSKLKENIEGLLACDLESGFELCEIESPEVIEHINQWLIIYSRMCCNRCNEAIFSVESWGISLLPLSIILTISNIDSSIKASVLNLIDAMYVDKYPFQRVSEVKDYLFSTENIIDVHQRETAPLCELSMWQFLGDTNDFHSLKFLIKIICDFWNNLESSLNFNEIDENIFSAKVLEITIDVLDFGFLDKEMVSKILKIICENFDFFPSSLSHTTVKILEVISKIRTFLQLPRIITDLKEFKEIEKTFYLLDDLPKMNSILNSSKLSVSCKKSLMHYFFEYIDQKKILLNSMIDRVHILPKADIIQSFKTINIGERLARNSSLSFSNISSEIDTKQLIRVLSSKKHIWNEMKALQFVISSLSLQEKVESLIKDEIDVERCLDFFLLFVRDNPEFKTRMTHLIPQLLKVSEYPKTVKLAVEIMRANSDFSSNLSIVDTLMKDINKTNNLKILRGLVLAERSSEPNILIQKKILSNTQFIDFGALIISPDRITFFEEVKLAGENSNQHSKLCNQIEILNLLAAASYK